MCVTVNLRKSGSRRSGRRQQTYPYRLKASWKRKRQILEGKQAKAAYLEQPGQIPGSGRSESDPVTTVYAQPGNLVTQDPEAAPRKQQMEAR